MKIFFKFPMNFYGESRSFLTFFYFRLLFHITFFPRRKLPNSFHGGKLDVITVLLTENWTKIFWNSLWNLMEKVANFWLFFTLASILRLYFFKWRKLLPWGETRSSNGYFDIKPNTKLLKILYEICRRRLLILLILLSLLIVTRCYSIFLCHNFVSYVFAKLIFGL